MIFSLGRVVIGIKWEKSLLWFSKEQSNDIRTHFLSIGLIERAEDKALSMIILPLCITIGIINKEDV